MMDNDEINLINDEPFGIEAEQPGMFLIRIEGERDPFAAVVADDMEELFWVVDEFANPRECECTALIGGDGYWFEQLQASERLEDRVQKPRAWRPVDDGSVSRAARAERIAGLENEVANLGKLFKNLKGKANDRFNRHGRRSRKDAGAVEEA